MATSARLDELKKKFDESPRRYFAPLANEFRKLGDLTQAIAICRAHLPNQPGHVSGHIVLAQALYESRELGESRVAFEQALDLDPENLIALRYLGDIAREQDAPDVARAWYERVLDADPRNDEIAALLNALPPANANEGEADYSEPSHQGAPTAVAEVDHAGSDTLSSWETPTIESLETGAEAFATTTNEVTPPPPALILDETSAFAIDEVVEFTPPAPGAVFEEFTISDTSDDMQPAAGSSATVPNELSAPAEDPFTAAFAEADAHAPREEVISLSDLEAIAEPQETGWFEETTAEAQTSDVAFSENLFADLSHATPPTTPALSEKEIDTFSLSLSVTPPMGVEQTPSSDAAEEVHAAASSEGDDDPFDFGQPLNVAADASIDGEEETEVVQTSSADDIDAFDFTTRPTPQLPMATITPWGATQATDARSSIDEGEEVEATASAPAWDAEASAEPEMEGQSTEIVAENADSADVIAASAFVDEVVAEQEEAPASTRFDAAVDVPEAGVAALSTSDTFFADVVEEHPPVDESAWEESSPSVDAVEGESFENDPIYGRTPAFGTEAVEETPDAFVTETMAELYVQQGFTEDALAIYRQLLSRNPDDATLQARIDALTFTSEEPALAPQVERSGQSARSFFAQFARRTPRRGQSEESTLPLADAGAPASAAPVNDPTPATTRGVATREEALTVPDEVHGAMPSSLESLFGSAPQSLADESAADTLASAFRAEPLKPQSNDAETQELSLQHLFGDVPAKSASTVSLDEFFATSRDESASPNELTPNGGERADIEQFTAWLEGLKKK